MFFYQHLLPNTKQLRLIRSVIKNVKSFSRINGASFKHNIAGRYTSDYIKRLRYSWKKKKTTRQYTLYTVAKGKNKHSDTLIITVLIFNELCTLHFPYFNIVC